MFIQIARMSTHLEIPSNEENSQKTSLSHSSDRSYNADSGFFPPHSLASN